MRDLQPRHSREEFARRGKDILERRVKPRLRPEDDNQFIAIDIESEDFEIDADDYTAAERLLARKPDAQIWLERAGQPAAYRIGKSRRGVGE
jgi:hypothetical protein